MVQILVFPCAFSLGFVSSCLLGPAVSKYHPPSSEVGHPVEITLWWGVWCAGEQSVLGSGESRERRRERAGGPR